MDDRQAEFEEAMELTIDEFMDEIYEVASNWNDNAITATEAMERLWPMIDGFYCSGKSI